VKRKLKSHSGNGEEMKEVKQRGILISSGLITSEALVGILMGIPIVLSGKEDVLAVFAEHDRIVPGIIPFLALL
jgi:uncharacterized oligopeptide transporter (OPT) family protein